MWPGLWGFLRIRLWRICGGSDGFYFVVADFALGSCGLGFGEASGNRPQLFGFSDSRLGGFMQRREMVLIVMAVALASLLVRMLKNHVAFGEATNKIAAKLF